MRKVLILIAIATALMGTVMAQDVAGNWLGLLDAGVVKLHIVFRITGSGSVLKVEMQSPDQNEAYVSATSAKLDASQLEIKWAMMNAVYKGTLSPDGQTLDGTWNQGAFSAPLKLQKQKPGEVVAGPKRPQTPIKPYPYKEEEVSYVSPKAGVKLAATLTIPAGKGPFPAVVLIPGSGAHDRDEFIMGHKPFLVLADYLTRHGIAVLRYDDRGVGRSAGSMATVTTYDLANDAEAGLEYLKTRPELDSKKLGLIGHSEGGYIAPLIASRNADVAYVVMLGGAGVTGEEIIIEQTRLMALAAGMTEEASKDDAAKERQILDAVVAGKSGDELAAMLVKIADGKFTAQQAKSAVAGMLVPWYKAFLSFDPAPALLKLKIPVLALDGSKDTQVPAAQNLPPIRKYLTEAGNQHFEAIEVPGVNHLFQHATKGTIDEYGTIEETMAPEVLAKIAEWINAQQGSTTQPESK